MHVGQGRGVPGGDHEQHGGGVQQRRHRGARCQSAAVRDDHLARCRGGGDRLVPDGGQLARGGVGLAGADRAGQRLQAAGQAGGVAGQQVRAVAAAGCGGQADHAGRVRQAEPGLQVTAGRVGLGQQRVGAGWPARGDAQRGSGHARGAAERCDGDQSHGTSVPAGSSSTRTGAVSCSTAGAAAVSTSRLTTVCAWPGVATGVIAVTVPMMTLALPAAG